MSHELNDDWFINEKADPRLEDSVNSNGFLSKLGRSRTGKAVDIAGKTAFLFAGVAVAGEALADTMEPQASPTGHNYDNHDVAFCGTALNLIVSKNITNYEGSCDAKYTIINEQGDLAEVDLEGNETVLLEGVGGNYLPGGKPAIYKHPETGETFLLSSIASFSTGDSIVITKLDLSDLGDPHGIFEFAGGQIKYITKKGGIVVMLGGECYLLNEDCTGAEYKGKVSSGSESASLGRWIFSQAVVHIGPGINDFKTTIKATLSSKITNNNPEETPIVAPDFAVDIPIDDNTLSHGIAVNPVTGEILVAVNKHLLRIPIPNGEVDSETGDVIGIDDANFLTAEYINEHGVYEYTGDEEENIPGSYSRGIAVADDGTTYWKTNGPTDSTSAMIIFRDGEKYILPSEGPNGEKIIRGNVVDYSVAPNGGLHMVINEWGTYIQAIIRPTTNSSEYIVPGVPFKIEWIEDPTKNPLAGTNEEHKCIVTSTPVRNQILDGCLNPTNPDENPESADESLPEQNPEPEALYEPQPEIVEPVEEIIDDQDTTDDSATDTGDDTPDVQDEPTDPCEDVECPAPDQCEIQSTCAVDAYGEAICVEGGPVANGTTCDDGNQNTTEDNCTDGTCSGDLLCEYVTNPHEGNICILEATCYEEDGKTQWDLNYNNNVQCDDFDINTTGDYCWEGDCAGTPLCDLVEDPYADNVCITGLCSAEDGSTSWSQILMQGECDDGDVNTVQDSCVNGECLGINICDLSTPPDLTDCVFEYACMPEGGSPAWNPMYYQDGSPCDDGNPATINDTCEDGVCEGEEPPVEPDPEPDPEPKPEDQPEVVEPDPEPKPEDQPEGTEPDPEPKPEDQPEVVEPEEVAEFEAASEEGEEIDQPDKKPIEFSQESSEPRPEVVDANPEAVVAEELKGETPGANCGTCTFTRNFRGPLDLASGAAMIAFMAAAIATLRRKTRVVYEGPKAIETKPDRFKKVFRARLAQSLSRRNAPSL